MKRTRPDTAIRNKQRSKELKESYHRLCKCGKPISYELRRNTYCSPECVSKYAKKTSNPDKTITFNCQTCSIEVTRYKSSTNAKRFCSNKCAISFTKRIQHINISKDDVLLDSSWEAAVYGIFKFLKYTIKRFDRTQVIEYAPGKYYGPDFIVETTEGPIFIEVKGFKDEDDPIKWKAFRDRGNHLVVIDDLTEWVDSKKIARVVKP